MWIHVVRTENHKQCSKPADTDSRRCHPSSYKGLSYWAIRTMDCGQANQDIWIALQKVKPDCLDLDGGVMVASMYLTFISSQIPATLAVCRDFESVRSELGAETRENVCSYLLVSWGELLLLLDEQTDHLHAPGILYIVFILLFMISCSRLYRATNKVALRPMPILRCFLTTDNWLTSRQLINFELCTRQTRFLKIITKGRFAAFQNRRLSPLLQSANLRYSTAAALLETRPNGSEIRIL